MIRLFYLDTGHTATSVIIRGGLRQIVFSICILIIVHLLACLTRACCLIIYVHKFRSPVMIAYSLDSTMRVTYCNAHWMAGIRGIHRSLAPANTQMH